MICLNAYILSYSTCRIAQNIPFNVRMERILGKIEIRAKTSSGINKSGSIGGKSFTLIKWIPHFI